MLRPLSITLLVLLAAATPAIAVETKVVGWVEEVRLNDVGTCYKAKMDTGAKTSSIDSEIIDIRKTGEKKLTKSGDMLDTGDTVVFSVKGEDGSVKTFERPIKRYVRIKLKNGGFTRRPVIVMNFCIAGRQVSEEVNLANRENFIYPVLIGRNMMEHAGLAINPAAKYVGRPICKLGD